MAQRHVLFWTRLNVHSKSRYSLMLCDGVTIEAYPECYRRVPPLEKGVRGIF